jgi:membrane-bound lytic murein transglycosylase D
MGAERSPLRPAVFAAAALCLVLTGCAGAPRDLPLKGSEPFPLPDALRDQVGFWRSVYAHWSRGMVAIHDDRHLALVYEVAELPGPIEPSYTPSQRDFVRAREDHWAARLSRLESDVLAGRSLGHAQRTLRRRIAADAGSGALIGASTRVRSQRGVRERFRRGLEVGARYDAKFREIFRRYGLPEDLAYLPHVESSFQLNARSSAGASGVWQFMPATARDYMRVDGRIDERLDPVVAADAAARYLRGAHARLHSWPLAVTSYNHGVGGMLRAKARYGDDIGRIVRSYDGRYFGFASRNFYAEFLAASHVARHAERYFPEGLRPEPPLADALLVLRSDTYATDLARHHRVRLSELTSRNLAWREPVRLGRTPVPAGTTVWLPPDAQGAGAGRASSGRAPGPPISPFRLP